MPETPLIQGRIAKLIDDYSVVINRGTEHGVKLGMVFNILSRNADVIIDPDTNAPIGSFSRGKALVRVTQVYEKWSVGTTFRMTAPNTGLGLGLDVLFKPPTTAPVLEKLRTAEVTWDKLAPPADATIATGDPVTEVRPLPSS